MEYCPRPWPKGAWQLQAGDRAGQIGADRLQEERDVMKVRSSAICVVACLLSAGAASANSLGTVKLKYDSADPRRSANIYLDGSFHGATVLAGQHNLQLDPSYSPTGEGQAVYDAADVVNSKLIVSAFCADVYQPAPSSYSYRTYDILPLEEAPVGGANDVTGPMTIAKADDLRRLFAGHYGVWQDGLNVESDDAAAFALCVWEIIFETDPVYAVTSRSGSRGDFYTTSGRRTFAALADSWLADIQADTGPVPNIELRVLANSSRQDYAIMVPGSGGAPPAVPEPVTILGLLMGAGGLAGYLRKRWN